MQLTITAHSTALFSTWIFIEEWRLLFDAGDGVMSHLQHRSRKIKNVAISHADRDHIFGLLQLNHHNAGHNLESVFYPRDARSIERLRDFAWRFDRDTSEQIAFVPVEPGGTVDLGANLALHPIRNTHLSQFGDQVRSLGYTVLRQFRKLKEEFVQLSQEDLRRIGTERGSAFLTEPREEALLTYTGDTGPCDADRWGKPKILIHEATFLRRDEVEEGWPGHEHTELPDALDVARGVGPEILVLHHLSSRYRMAEIASEVRRHATEMRIPFPIWVLPPGQTVENLLGLQPVWKP
jgi:ribonuclease Z